MVAKIYFFHRPQSDRDPVRNHRAAFSADRLFFDDADAVATGLSRPGAASDWQMAPAHLRAGLDAGRKTDARFLQFVRGDARHSYDFSGSCAIGVRRVW